MKFVPLSETQQQTEGGDTLKFVPLSEAPQPEGAKPLRFVPLAEQASAPVVPAPVAAPTKVATKPTEAAEGVLPNKVDFAGLVKPPKAALTSAAAPAPAPVAPISQTTTQKQPSEFAAIEEAGKGVASGAIGLKSMWENVGVMKDVGALGSVQQRLGLFGKIDAGEITDPNQLRGLDLNTSFARSYLAASPAMRDKMKERMTKEVANRTDFVKAAVATVQQYQKDAEKYKGRTTDLTDVRGVADFTNWLAFNMGSGAVQMAPIMLAALTTGPAGLALMSTGMGTAEAVGNRLQFLAPQLKGKTPDEQAAIVIDYIARTGSTNLAVGLVSGAFDTLLGPAANLAKQGIKKAVGEKTWKEILKQGAKDLPKVMGQEAVTGGAQEFTQQAGAYKEDEIKKLLTKQTAKKVLNAAAAEATGVIVPHAGTTGVRAVLAGQGASTFPGEAPKVEPTAGEEGAESVATSTTTGRTSAPSVTPAAPAAPVPPTAAEDTRVEPTLETTTPTLEPTTPTLEQQEKELYDQSVEQLVARGIPEDSAARIAARRVREARKQRIRDLIVKPTQDEIDNRAKELIDSGMDPALAIDEAAKQITAEREADAFSASELGGAGSVESNVPAAVGESVEVAGQPVDGAPAAGVGVAKPDTVVPTGQPAATDVGGEGVQPGAVGEKFNPFTFASQSADSAFADSGSFGSVEESIAAHRENIVDTLREQGRDDPRTVNMALDLYDAAVNARFGNQPSSETTQPTDGTQTTEAQQAETQGQEAPAAGAPGTGKKRGRPTVLTPEEKEQRTLAKGPAQAAKARADRAIARIKKLLDSLTQPEAVDKYSSPEEAEKGIRDERRAAVQELLALQADPNLRGTKVAQRIKEALAHPSITAKELADLKAGLAAKQSQASSSVLGKAQPNPVFSTFKNASQAISYIIRNGTKAQQLIAKRLRSFVQGVEFVVIEQGQELPEMLKRHSDAWDRSIGIFIENYKTGARAIYVRGASFGDQQGVNNVTILHELFHAATNRKIVIAEEQIRSGNITDTKLIAAYKLLRQVMRKAQDEFGFQLATQQLPKHVAILFDSTDGEVVGDPREFLAYGMTDDAFQDFLAMADSVDGAEDPNLLSSFVRSLRRFFGIPSGEQNALTNLVLATDLILSSRAPRMSLAGEAASSSVIPEGEDEFGNPIRTPKEIKAASEKAKGAVEMSRSFEELKPSLVRKAWVGMTDLARRAWVATPTFTFLADTSGIASLKDADKNIQLMNGMANNLMRGAYKLLVPLERALNPLFSTAASKRLRRQVEDLALESTIARYDPADTNSREFDPRLHQMYLDIGPKGQKLYRMVRDYYTDLIDLFSDVLDQQIENLRGMSPEAKNNLMLTLRRTFEAEARIRPYFPLVRRGDFWARFNVDDEPVFLMFESSADRRASLEELAKERNVSLDEWVSDGKVSFGKGGIRGLRAATQGQSAMLTQIFDALDKEDFSDPEVRESIKDAVYQIYLTTMPEQSFRNQFMRRKDRIGFSTDLIRNVATSASKMSKQLARLKYAPLLRNNIASAVETASQNDALSPFVEEATKRVDKVLKGHEDDAFEAAAGIANKVGYYMYLSSAASALVQPASIYISALPVLGANHNSMTGAAAQLVRAIGEVQKYGVITTNADGSTSHAAPSLANSSRLTPNEQRAVRDMAAYNVSGNTFASLVWGRQGVATNSASTVLGKAGKLGKDAGNLMVSALMHNVERLTREAVFLASYRMGYKRFSKQRMTPDEAHTAAVEQAVSDVNESLANYDPSNRPRYMQGAIGRAAFLFRLFPIHTMLLLGTNFIKMLPLLNKEGKAAAAKKFMGIYLTAGSIAGLMGVPFFGPIVTALAWAIQQSFKDDDDIPEELRNLDPELWFRSVFLPELTGNMQIGGVPLSEILDTGPLNAITGSAIAERIGLADLLGRETKEARTAREDVQNYAFEKLGVHASTALTFADAYDAARLGDYPKAAEKLAPAVIRNPMLAAKMAKEGIKDADGNVIKGPDEVSAWKIFMQGVGFRPAEVAKISEDTFKLKSSEQRILNEKKLILGRMKVQIRKDTEEGDDRLLKIIDKEVDAFNRRYPSFAMNGSEIRDILRKDLEGRAGSRMGFRQNKQNFGLSDKVLSHLEQRIDREKAATKK